MQNNNDSSPFISQTAQIWGNVEFSEGSSAWFGTLIRSVRGQIQIGKNSHINDQTRIANNSDAVMYIGDNVYIGSQCNLSDCEIANHCYIGDHTIIYPGSIIPENSFIAPNSLVISQTIFHASSFIQGAPASCAGYVVDQMREEYYQSLSKMQKNIGYFRSLLPNSERAYYLLEFSVAGGRNQKLLKELFAVGAGEFCGTHNYVQSFARKVECSSKPSAAPTAKQELVYAVFCPGDKLHAATQILNQHAKLTNLDYQIRPYYASERPKQWGAKKVQRPIFTEAVTQITEEALETENPLVTSDEPEKPFEQEEFSTSTSFWWENDEALASDSFDLTISNIVTTEDSICDLYPEFYADSGDLKPKEELPNAHLDAIMLRSELHES